MNNQPAENTNIDWEEIILTLQAFTRSLVNGKKWFRGKQTNVFLKGKEIDDYVYGAIEKYLHHPEKFDPEKGTLINYLQFNLIRSLVSNDSSSAENKTSKNALVTEELGDTGEDGEESYSAQIVPFTDAYFDQDVDYKNILSEIEAELNGDKLLENIFLGSRIYGMERREIIKEFELSTKDYDNGIRRLTTILNNIAKKYDMKIQPI